MPIYTYFCEEHGEQEHAVKYEERDGMTCRECQGPLRRQGMERPGLLKPEGGYQMGVYLGSSRTGRQTETFKGHFGKDAPKRSGFKKVR